MHDQRLERPTARAPEPRRPLHAGCGRGAGVLRAAVDSRAALAFGVALVAFAWLARGTAVRAGERPHIVIILADDMGYGDVGCYNDESRIETPRMDRLAREGVRLTDAHSPSAVCTPTRYGLLTGRYAWRTWLKRGVVGGYTPPLIEPERPTIASVLSSAGYRTACVGKWHLGLGWRRASGEAWTWESAREHFGGSWQDGDPEKGEDVDFTRPIVGGPRALGFDEVYITAACSTIDGPFCFIDGDRTVGIPDRKIEVDRSRHPDFRPRPGWTVEGFDLTRVDIAFTDRAVDFLETSVEDDPERPVFLYLALSSPHAPWLPPEETLGTTAEGPRGDLVALVDRCVGRVVDTLERLDIADETLLIVTSDNGPRHGGYRHESARPWRGHKSHIWEGGHRVPFIARWPGRIPAGSVSEEPIVHTDLFPTAAGVAGAVLPADAAPDGFDILPALRGRELDAPIREAVVSHSVFGVFSVRQGRWKLIEGTKTSGGWVDPSGEGPKEGAPGQLYDVESDPGETRDLFEAEPEVAARLAALLERYRRDGRSAPPRE